MSGRGRPPGRSPKGLHTEARLYEVATRLFAERGYEATTLRAIASEAGVSPGLLYRYFPNKASVVVALYERLSTTYAERTAQLPAGAWSTRFMLALRCSLEVLGPHRAVLAAALQVLLMDREHGLLAERTRDARERIRGTFVRCTTEADSAPREAEALGRLLYVIQLAVLLGWLMDRSPGQRATWALLGLLEGAMSLARIVLRLPGAAGAIVHCDALFTEALFPPGEEGSEE